MSGLWTRALLLLGILPAQPQFPSRPDSFLCWWPFLKGGCEQGRQSDCDQNGLGLPLCVGPVKPR